METKVITILNKLNRKDSVTNLDVWYKNTLHNIPYSVKTVATVAGTTTSIGQSFVLLIPFDKSYKPYSEWKNKPNEGYTLSQGDLIILGEEITDLVTPNNVLQVKNNYKPNVVEIRSITEVADNGNALYRFKIEGV